MKKDYKIYVYKFPDLLNYLYNIDVNPKIKEEFIEQLKIVYDRSSESEKAIPSIAARIILESDENYREEFMKELLGLIKEGKKKPLFIEEKYRKNKDVIYRFMYDQVKMLEGIESILESRGEKYALEYLKDSRLRNFLERGLYLYSEDFKRLSKEEEVKVLDKILKVLKSYYPIANYLSMVLFGEEAPKNIRFNFEKISHASGVAQGKRGGEAFITLELKEIENLARYFISGNERYYIKFIRLFSHEIVHTLGGIERGAFREEEAFANLVSSVYILNKFGPYKCKDILIEEFLSNYEHVNENLSVYDFYSLGALAGLSLLNLHPKERLEIAKKGAELLEKYKDPIKFDNLLLEYAKKALEIEMDNNIKEKIKHFLESFEKKKVKERKTEISKEFLLLILVASTFFIFFIAQNKITGFFILEDKHVYTILLAFLIMLVVFIGFFSEKIMRKLKTIFRAFHSF